jgi:hypothetical protein
MHYHSTKYRGQGSALLLHIYQSKVQISAKRLAIVSELFYGLPWSFPENKPQLLPFTSFPIHHSQIILPFEAMQLKKHH